MNDDELAEEYEESLQDETRFNFVRNQFLRSNLERDYAELRNALRVKASKAAVVLSGSIIEAILVDYVLPCRQSKRGDPTKWGLKMLIEECDGKVLSSQAVELSTVVRDYRNLIHPGRLLGENEVVDQDTAEVAFRLVSIISRQVRQAKFERGEMAAESLADRIVMEQHVGTVLSDLLRPLTKKELERLALEVLPNRVQDTLGFVNPEDEQYQETVLRYRQCYRIVYSALADAAKRKATKGVVDAVRGADESTAIVYEDVFLEAGDTANLTEANRRLLLRHLLGRLDAGPTRPLREALRGIGKYLMPSEVSKLLRVFATDIAGGKSRTVALSRAALVREAKEMSEDTRAKLLEVLDNYAQALRDQNHSERADRIMELRFLIVPPDFDIPF